MKKIIGAALATSMLAGSAFAADLSFSYSGNNYFNVSNTAKQTYGYDAAARADCLSVGLSNESAGVVLDFDYDSGSFVQDQYYAWMTFSLPVGNLQITAGNWNGIYSDDVTTDAGDLDSEDFIGWDMGILNPNGSVGANSDDLTYDAANDENVLSTVFAWTLSDSLPGSLLLKGGIVSVDEYDSFKAQNGSDASWKSGFIGEVAYRQDGLVNIDFAFKNFRKSDASFALFVSPLMVENLEATLGLTLATELPSVSKITAKKSDLYDRVFDFAIDLRARYQFSDALSLTTAHNFTIYNSYDVAATSDETTYDDTFVGMANQIAIAYKIAENLTAKFNYQQYTTQAFEYHDNCFFDNVYFTPSVEIAATEKATVTVGSRFAWENVGHEGNESLFVTIPIIFIFNY